MNQNTYNKLWTILLSLSALYAWIATPSSSIADTITSSVFSLPKLDFVNVTILGAHALGTINSLGLLNWITRE